MPVMYRITMKRLFKIIGIIVSLMILICLTDVGLMLLTIVTLFKTYCGLAIIGSFIVSAVVLGLYVNYIINKIVSL
jgi:hypothetical protein